MRAAKNDRSAAFAGPVPTAGGQVGPPVALAARAACTSHAQNPRGGSRTVPHGAPLTLVPREPGSSKSNRACLLSQGNVRGACVCARSRMRVCVRARVRAFMRACALLPHPSRLPSARSRACAHTNSRHRGIEPGSAPPARRRGHQTVM